MILWKYKMDQVKTWPKAKAAVHNISFCISSNVTIISLVLLFSQTYFIFLINVPSLLFWLHLCSWHKNHTDKFVHGLQRLESGFAEVPLSLLFKTVAEQLELWSTNCFWTHCCSQAQFKWLYLWLQAIYHVKSLGANDWTVKYLWVIRDAFKAYNVESHLKNREDAWLIMQQRLA